MTTQTRSNIFVGSVAILIALAAAGAFSVSAHEAEGRINNNESRKASFIESLPADVRAEFEILVENDDKQAIRALFKANDIAPPKYEKRSEWLASIPETLRVELRALHEAGYKETVRDFLEDNDLDRHKNHGKMSRIHNSVRVFIKDLPTDIRTELQTLRERGDRAGARAVLEANGYERPTKSDISVEASIR